MTSQPTVLILNGPNLNLLGTREPEIYGHETLADVERRCVDHVAGQGIAVDFRQSNDEGTLVDAIQESRGKHAGIIINAGAYTHTSVAIHDALKAVDIPVLEVHLSNPYTREEFRHTSYVAPAATGSICGLGAQGYELALTAIARLIKDSN